MTVRPIVLWPDARLQQACKPAVPESVGALVQDLFDTMYDAGGRGLAAPQVGMMLRVFVIDMAWKSGPRMPRAFINPQVVNESTEGGVADEQCLSIPDLPMPVWRSEKIELTWDNSDGRDTRDRFHGVTARCILHEIDHLDGHVIFDHQTPERRREFEAIYGG